MPLSRKKSAAVKGGIKLLEQDRDLRPLAMLPSRTLNRVENELGSLQKGQFVIRNGKLP